LEKEHDDLQRDLGLIESPANQKRNDKQCEGLKEQGKTKSESDIGYNSEMSSYL